MARYLEQRLKIRHLRVIDAVEQHKSVLRASQALGVSQPTLTRSLQEVEEIIGAALFERHARGVRANETGRMLAERARTLLGIIRRTEDDLAGLADDRRRSIRVGALPVAALGLMPAVIAHTNVQGARLTITLTEGRTPDLIAALERGDIDVIVGRLYEPPMPDSLTRRVLYDEPISLIARHDHPVFESGAMTAKDVARYPLVLPALSSLIQREVIYAIEELGLPIADAVQSGSVGFIRELLMNGDFITAMPRVMVAGDLTRASLKILPVEVRRSPRPAGLIFRDDLGAAGDLMLAEIGRELSRLADEDVIVLPD